MKVPLIGGFYQASSLIANAQRCVNLYPEKNPEDSPFPYTHYLTPGTIYLTNDPANEVAWRCLYTASNGAVYGVIGIKVYTVTGNLSAGYVLTLIGTMTETSANAIVYMQDNSLVLVLTDGSKTGYAIDLSNNDFAVITDPAFLGATKVDYLDTFLIFNEPGTADWYISMSLVTFGMLTGVLGSLQSGAITDPGVNYLNGTFKNIPFTGGTGTGATGNFTISGGIFQTAEPNIPGQNYVAGDILTVALPGDSGVNSGHISNGGANYLNGTYTNVSLSGGSGTGAQATIVVADNVVTTVTITNSGVNYSIGDILTTTIVGTEACAGNIINSGSSLVNGTYTNFLMTGGNGTGALGNTLIVALGMVTTFVLQPNTGSGYIVGDILSSSVADNPPTSSPFSFILTSTLGNGFSYTVDGTGGTGFTYTISTVGGNAFDPLDFASKVGYPDPIQNLIVMDLYIWLVGTKTTEIWFNAGAADFTFQIMPGVFIEHGCIAPFTLCKQDLSVYWLSQDAQGQTIVLKGNSFAAHRISTHAIEQEISKYSVISDAIGFIYQKSGHVFYVLNFPTANKTWVWDETSQLWHERSYLNGQPNRIPAQVICNDNGVILTGNTDGSLNYFSDTAYTDNGLPIVRVRSFPHILDDQNRVMYGKFVADMECGTDDPTVTGDSSSTINPPVVSLRWSDDRGRTYNNYIHQSLGALGQYLTNMQWQRLGMARDRVFELSWSVPTKTALSGAWIELQKVGT